MKDTARDEWVKAKLAAENCDDERVQLLMCEAWDAAQRIELLHFDPERDILLVTMPHTALRNARDGTEAMLKDIPGAKKVIVKPPDVKIELLGPSIYTKGLRVGYELAARRIAPSRVDDLMKECP